MFQSSSVVVRDAPCEVALVVLTCQCRAWHRVQHRVHHHHHPSARETARVVQQRHTRMCERTICIAQCNTSKWRLKFAGMPPRVREYPKPRLVALSRNSQEFKVSPLACIVVTEGSTSH